MRRIFLFSIHLMILLNSNLPSSATEGAVDYVYKKCCGLQTNKNHELVSWEEES
jgi:hypothetical protein